MSKAKLQIVADANMPQASEIFAPIGSVQLLSGRSIGTEDLQQADVLLVRSVTAVDTKLLAGTPVKFVGTATAGVDHIAERIRSSSMLGFSDAKGCNANSVVEYVLACLAQHFAATGVDTLESAIGIVGAGCVGSALAKVLTELGAQVVVYDPLVQCKYGQQVSSLSQLQHCQAISVHTPLTTDGRYPTHGLLNAGFIDSLPTGGLLIAAGRGAVVDEAAALQAIIHKQLRYCADVWTGEPRLNREVMAAAVIATPHIAGYSLDGKLKATQHLFNQVKAHFKLDAALPSVGSQALTRLSANTHLSGRAQFYELLRQAWPLHVDDEKLRAAVSQDNSGVAFDALRANMQGRLEFHNYEVTGLDSTAAGLAAVVGFQLA